MSKPKADQIAEGEVASTADGSTPAQADDTNASSDAIAQTIVASEEMQQATAAASASKGGAMGGDQASAFPLLPSETTPPPGPVEDAHNPLRVDTSSSGMSTGDSSIGVRPRSFAPGELPTQFSGVYDIKSKLGSGGMGAVYRARDRSLHRTVAIKVMHDEVAAREHMVRRFYKEAQITAQLEHPGIVPTYGIDMSGSGQPRLAMRLIRGQTLEELIRSLRKSEPHARDMEHQLFDRLELFVRTCDAVQFAHERGVVHRDLKPDNIMVGPHRDAYVMDWGLATLKTLPDEELSEQKGPNSNQAIDVDEDLKATRFGELMGTVAYMPPEQALGDLEQIGPHSDQFAMGMTLLELVTLEQPRKAPNITAGVTQAVLGQKQPIPKAVPRGLAAIIDKATAFAPQDRYPSMRDFAEDVRRFLRDEELSVLPDGPSKKVWRLLNRHQTLVLVGLLGLVTISAASLITHLAERANRERAQALHAAHVTKLQGAVTARAQAINARIRGVEIEAARLAGKVQQALLRPEPEAVDVVTPVEMRSGQGPADTKFLERYGQKISFERAVFARAPDATGADADRDERRLSTLEADFKESFDSGGFVKGTRKSESTAPLQWIYAGTPSGVLINYPAGSGLMPDYDPRTRPWYATNISSVGPQWGGLYGDASGSGTLLPCNRAVYDHENHLLAIVGIDFRLTDMEADVPMRELAGFRSAWLLNQNGDIVVRSKDRALSGPDVQDLDQRKLEHFPESVVLQEIAEQPGAGQVEIGSLRYLYAQVPALGWSYVVAADISK